MISFRACFSGVPCSIGDRLFHLHSRRVLWSRTADMFAVSRSRRVCNVTQQTCLLCHTADMSVVSRMPSISQCQCTDWNM